MPGTILSILHLLIHFISEWSFKVGTIILIDRETEAWEFKILIKATQLKSQNLNPKVLISSFLISHLYCYLSSRTYYADTGILSD